MLALGEAGERKPAVRERLGGVAGEVELAAVEYGRSFSAKPGSSLALSASCRSRMIWRASRAGSAGGAAWWAALRWPTCWVHLKRSASIWTTAASMLSMLSRNLVSSSRTDG
ncbi:hypothetical protein SANTM175S_10612 [Streptomyces antimycoticus]